MKKLGHESHFWHTLRGGHRGHLEHCLEPADQIQKDLQQPFPFVIFFWKTLIPTVPPRVLDALSLTTVKCMTFTHWRKIKNGQLSSNTTIFSMKSITLWLVCVCPLNIHIPGWHFTFFFLKHGKRRQCWRWFSQQVLDDNVGSNNATNCEAVAQQCLSTTENDNNTERQTNRKRVTFKMTQMMAN